MEDGELRSAAEVLDGDRRGKFGIERLDDQPGLGLQPSTAACQVEDTQANKSRITRERPTRALHPRSGKEADNPQTRRAKGLGTDALAAPPNPVSYARYLRPDVLAIRRVVPGSGGWQADSGRLEARAGRCAPRPFVRVVVDTGPTGYLGGVGVRICSEKGCNGLAPFELDDGAVWAVCRAHLEELLPGAPAALESTSRDFRRRGGLFIDGLLVRDVERAHWPRLDRRERAESDGRSAQPDCVA
jgi:hypothetical protein